MKPWYRSCPHACSDPETCPYGRAHLPQIRALIQKVAEFREELEMMRKRFDETYKACGEWQRAYLKLKQEKEEKESKCPTSFRSK
jgi:hypothetical protein